MPRKESEAVPEGNDPVKNSDPINPRWRTYIGCLKKYSKGSGKKIRAFLIKWTSYRDEKDESAF